jgi:hypothetical protein
VLRRWAGSGDGGVRWLCSCQEVSLVAKLVALVLYQILCANDLIFFFRHQQEKMKFSVPSWNIYVVIARRKIIIYFINCKNLSKPAERLYLVPIPIQKFNK